MVVYLRGSPVLFSFFFLFLFQSSNVPAATQGIDGKAMRVHLPSTLLYEVPDDMRLCVIWVRRDHVTQYIRLSP